MAHDPLVTKSTTKKQRQQAKHRGHSSEESDPSFLDQSLRRALQDLFREEGPHGPGGSVPAPAREPPSRTACGAAGSDAGGPAPAQA